MTEPAPRVLLAGLPLARMVKDPEFAIEGIEPKAPSPFVREIMGRLCYVNFTQIFRAKDPTDPNRARERVEFEMVRALNWGLQSEGLGGFAQHRLTAGLEFLEEYVGAPIDPAACRLAILRPMEVERVERYEPTPAEKAKAADLGMELVGAPAYYEVRVECGLDLVRRVKRR